VHDQLTATALAIETRGQNGVIDQAVMVSCDLMAIRRKTLEKVRELVRKQAPDLDVKKILISTTHTHTAPALTDAEETDLHPYEYMGSWAYRIPPEREDVMRQAEYLDFLAERISAAVVEAWQARKPGGMSAALGHAVVAHNRRTVYVDGTAKMYGNTNDRLFSHIEGVSDHSVDMLFFWRDDKRLEGMALNVYCTAQEVASQRYLSADFWYDARQLLRKKYGVSLYVLPLVGAAGDQSPRLLWNKKSEAAMRQRRKLSSREETARRILRAVENVFDVARNSIQTELPFQHRVERAPLPVWKVSDQRHAQALATYKAGKDRTDKLSNSDYGSWCTSRAILARYAYQKKDPYYKAELHLLRLGDVAVATNPFELYTDYGLRIKARSSAVQTFVVQLTSDCAGYLPTPRAVRGGGYSARIEDGIVGPEGGTVLVDQTVEAINAMWEDKQPKQVESVVPDLIFDGDPNSSFNLQIVCGDVDGDGYDDILMGSHEYNSYRGRVYLFYGGPDMDTTADLVLEGQNEGDWFGNGIVCGDIDNDGYEDIIIGAGSYSENQGRAYLYWGSDRHSMDANPDKIFDGEAEKGAQFGAGFPAVYDIDNDGYDDIILGAIGGSARAGQAYLYYGNTKELMDTSPDLIFAEDPHERFGCTISCGDVNNDGYGDIVVGANVRQGRAYLYYGASQSNMDAKADVIFEVESEGYDNFGSGIVCVDQNRDGYDDVVIGARGYNNRQGRAYIFRGNSKRSLYADPDMTFDGEVEGSYYGNPAVCGDIDGDNVNDLVIGAGGFGQRLGRVYLYWGKDLADPNPKPGRIFPGENPNDGFGKGLACGDVNNDGFDDLVIGAPGYKDKAGAKQGRAYLYYGGPEK
jgi:hypothetical protein